MSRPNRTLQVFPDASRRQQVLRAARETRGLVLGTGCLTWDEFVNALGGAGELNRRPCPVATSHVLMGALAQGLEETPFGDFVNEPAFARAALELVLDMKAGRLTPRELQDAIEVLPVERRPRARVLARLYDGYERRMAELGLADREDVLRGSREALMRGAWPEAWEDVGALVLHGVYDVRPSGLELLLRLATVCEARRVSLRVETPVGGSQAADAALAALFRAFENRGELVGHVDLFKADLTFDKRPLTELGRHLFSPRVARGTQAPKGDALRMWSVATARDEARQIARDVRRLVSDGVAPDRIAVAWREPGPEARWMAEALEELGVPARLPWGEPLALVGPVRLALGLPLLVEDGFPAERVAELVASRYASTLSRGAPQAPATLFTLAALRDDRLGASRGRGAYDVRLESLARRMVASKDARAYSARLLRERCVKLIEECRRIPTEASALEMLSAWWHGVRQLGLMDSEGELQPREEGLLGEYALEARVRDDAARRALQLRVGELERALRRVGGGPRLTRRTFGRWLADAVRDAHLPPRGPASGAVEVLDIRELPGRTFGYLFLAGMTEGRFPGREEPHPLLGDADRNELNKHLRRDVFRLTGGEFDDRAPWRLTEDRLLFASALVAAEERVSLSFGAAGAGGQEQVPSAFLEEVRRLTGLKYEARSLMAVPPLDEVLTEPELRQRVALETMAQPRLRVTEPDVAASILKRRFEDEVWYAAARELAHVEVERLHFFSNPSTRVGPHSGAVEGLDEALRETFRFDITRPLSASALARFGNCGFQGFLTYGLKVAEPEEPGEEFDARGRGTFWHRVVEEVFQRLQKKGLLGKGLEEIPEEVLNEALADAVRYFEERHHVGHPALWQLAKERAKSMVRRILADERRGLPFEKYEPQGFELKFGPGADEDTWQNVFLYAGKEAIYFEGKIDRLDKGAEDVGVIDYKSGRLEERTLRKRLLSSDFQLPLYLYAARASGHQKARKAAWFSLRTGAAVHLDEVLSPQEVEGMLSTEPEVRAKLKEEGGLNLANAVEDLVLATREGKFAMRPKDCGGCGYRAVCRITERRVVEEGA
ncbi:PD-(D/E)XK nuclease family protein [Hyalangium rubrum]|uniref:PD-(D/E)XK nuclease family protein n=1 Tax=Hyalangium rubrum TaxID=3103134 RepID=A0ABU5GVP6_9BACT|nr:PD-(D/E)XK nuclease family protein [Hyalangium sp. s54d21]MDY7225263.1 PD-(D/E)XK nuclease family protein [Hyalangium sp. s54d21]